MKAQAVECKLQNPVDYLYKNENSLLLIKFVFRGWICNWPFLCSFEKNNQNEQLELLFFERKSSKLASLQDSPLHVNYTNNIPKCFNWSLLLNDIQTQLWFSSTVSICREWEWLQSTQELWDLISDFRRALYTLQ